MAATRDKRPPSEASRRWSRLDPRSLPRSQDKPPEHALAIDMFRKHDAIVVRADVPGNRACDVKIEVEDGVLSLSGSHAGSREEPRRGQVFRRERRHGSFSRSVRLPVGAEPGSMSVTCKDGVLELTIPTPRQHEEEEPTTRKRFVRERSP